MRPIVELECTAFTREQLAAPPPLPQIALAGRSNVGKSSLLNRLAGRKGLAKTSATPGKTRSINFYRVQPFGFYLVDLPGYGFARASKADRATWGKLIEGYLKGNRLLRAVVVLLDSRLQPQRLDLEMAAYLSSLGLPVLPVLTKADKTRQKDRAALATQWRHVLGTEPLAVSSKTGVGVERLLARIVEAVGDGPAPANGD
jgi:GTP-binding protein